MAEEFRLGVDVGGTFTDVVLLGADGAAYHRKVLSTPQDFSLGIKRGIQEALADHHLEGRQIREYTHGATVATNAIITRSGAVTALITTRGFRDVLEIRRMRVHRLYDLDWEKPEPLVPRHLRFEVPARVSSTGEERDPPRRGSGPKRSPAIGRGRGRVGGCLFPPRLRQRRPRATCKRPDKGSCA